MESQGEANWQVGLGRFATWWKKKVWRTSHGQAFSLCGLQAVQGSLPTYKGVAQLVVGSSNVADGGIQTLAAMKRADVPYSGIHRTRVLTRKRTEAGIHSP